MVGCFYSLKSARCLFYLFFKSVDLLCFKGWNSCQIGALGVELVAYCGMQGLIAVFVMLHTFSGLAGDLGVRALG